MNIWTFLSRLGVDWNLVSRGKRRRHRNKGLDASQVMEERVLLAGDNILIVDDFESGTPSSDWTEVYSADSSDNVVSGIAHSGNNSYRIRYTYDEDEGKLQKYGFESRDEFYVRYWQMYPDGFVQRNLKQSHIFNTNESTPYEGVMILSLWGQIDEQPVPNNVQLLTTIYGGTGLDPDIQASYDSFPISPGEWFRTAYYVKMNTPGQKNGVYKLWQNDRLVLELNNVQFRTSAATPDGVWIGGNYSGGGQDPVAFDRYIDDILVARTPDDDVVSPSLTQPTLKAPTSFTAVQRPTVSWNSVSGAVSYDIEIRNLATNATPVTQNAVAGTSFTPSANLGIGRMEARVRAVSLTGAKSKWSVPRAFTINTPVTLIAMTQPQTTRRPKILWNALPGAARYDLKIDSVTTGATQVIRQQALTTTFFTPLADLPNGTYRIWVRGIDSAGVAASWSQSKDLVVAANTGEIRTVLINEDFEDGVINGFDELPPDNDGHGSSARLISGYSAGAGNRAFAITYARDESEAKLQKYNLANYDALEVEFATRLPDGIPVENTGNGFAGLKLSRLFRSSGNPGGNQLQVQLDYLRANYDYPGSPPTYSVSFFLPNGEKVLRVPISFSRDSWFHIRYLAKMNTPGQANGELTVWLNGVQAGKLTGMNYSKTVADRPDGMWVGGNFSYHGVNPESPFRRLIDNVKLTVIKGTTSLKPPQLNAVTTPNSSLRPGISWSTVSGASRYEIEIDNLTTNTARFVSAVVPGTSFTPNVNLGIGRMQVRVRGLDSNGNRSGWSSVREFMINTPATLKSMAANQITYRPKFQWNALPGAVKYDVRIDNLTTGQSQVLRVRNVTGTTFVPSSDLPLSKYQVWVAGIDAEGRSARWSPGVQFSVTPQPSLLGPLTPTFVKRPVFTWRPVVGAVSYDVCVRNLTTGKTDFYPKGIVGTSWTPPTNLSSGPYRWWVQAVGQQGIRSAWSTPADIYVGGRPTVLQPTGSIVSVRPKFIWTAVTGAASYRIWVNRLDVAKAAVVNVSGINTNTFTATTNLAKGTYRVWIQAVSTSGERSVWSNAVDFTIVDLAIPDVKSEQFPPQIVNHVQDAKADVIARRDRERRRAEADKTSNESCESESVAESRMIEERIQAQSRTQMSSFQIGTVQSLSVISDSSENSDLVALLWRQPDSLIDELLT